MLGLSESEVAAGCYLGRVLRIWLLAVVVTGWLTDSVRAELTRFEIQARESFAEGVAWGESGPYERITGRLFFELDPDRSQNKTIIDLKLAPRNGSGRVEFFSDFFILAPVDLSKANGAVLYDVNNRGNKLAVRFFNNGGGGNDPRTVADAGDGFLMRKGFIIVWSGWDGELQEGDNRLRLSAPVATEEGRVIKGLVRCEFVPAANNKRQPVVNWANHGSYLPTAEGLLKATLTHRVRANDIRIPVPREQWKIHVTQSQSPQPGELPKVEVELPAGLERGHLYELIYEAQDPLVHGVCFAGVRDLISALRSGSGKNNPLLLDRQPVVKRAHAFGVSQSGRFLREFLYSGFNEAESGQKVFDAIIPHVSGSGMGSFNHRFAQPTRHATQHDHADYPPDRFPFSYGDSTDPFFMRTDGLLRRATASGTAPFVLHTQSAAEYWTRSGSLTHTDPLAREDLPLPSNVRIYLFGGTQHGPAGFPPGKGDAQNLVNPSDYRPFLRALLMAVDQWSQGGPPAPPSVFPTIAAGTLVDWKRSATGFPNIPGVTFPNVIRQPAALDFGPRWWSDGIVDQQPPIPRGQYVMRVPRCDEDGNELGCLLPPEVAVPLATCTGWNLRTREAGAEGELVSLTGSYIPFPRTKAEREASGDPRRSLEERYASADDYARKLEAYCQELVEAGYLLKDDVPGLVKLHRERAAAAMTHQK